VTPRTSASSPKQSPASTSIISSPSFKFSAVFAVDDYVAPASALHAAARALHAALQSNHNTPHDAKTQKRSAGRCADVVRVCSVWRGEGLEVELCGNLTVRVCGGLEEGDVEALVCAVHEALTHAVPDTHLAPLDAALASARSAGVDVDFSVGGDVDMEALEAALPFTKGFVTLRKRATKRSAVSSRTRRVVLLCRSLNEADAITIVVEGGHGSVTGAKALKAARGAFDALQTLMSAI